MNEVEIIDTDECSSLFFITIIQWLHFDGWLSKEIAFPTISFLKALATGVIRSGDDGN